MAASDGRIRWQLARLKRRPREKVDPFIVGMRVALNWVLNPDSGCITPVGFARFGRKLVKREVRHGE